MKPPVHDAGATHLLGLEGRTLVLASGSPRRIEILRSLGVPFRIRAVTVDETVHPGEAALDACLRLARRKVQAAAAELSDEWILGADTLVVVDGVSLGKPESEADATRMLRQLSGRMHEVWTGLALRRVSDEVVLVGAERTRVWFDVLEASTIALLARADESLDKAGGYGIQGLAGPCISRIEGDYYNVMGLPLARLRQLCHEAARKG